MDVPSEVLQLAKNFLTKVRRSGPENIEAVCPFHLKADGTPERTPSFRMSLTKGVYFCHSCGEKGNLFTFLRANGVTRSEIDGRYSYILDQASKNAPPPQNAKNPKRVFALEPLPEAVLGFFDYAPKALLSRGFSMETLRHFDIGYDPWHQRITYPLRDLNGRLVGISGRADDGRLPRYKVYTTEYLKWGLPERGQPEKTGLLWNAHQVYPSVYFLSPGAADVVVVEGYKAAMWLWQCGVKNVVALMGTYLSWEHQWILERLGARVYLLLDNNMPGRNGMITAAENLVKSLNVYVVEYPKRLVDDDDAQPDDLTAQEAKEAIANARTYMSWLLSFA